MTTVPTLAKLGIDFVPFERVGVRGADLARFRTVRRGVVFAPRKRAMAIHAIFDPGMAPTPKDG
jgi:hypothetical protein